MLPLLKPHSLLFRTRRLNYRSAFQSYRALHEAKAKLVTFDTKGSLKTQILDIFIGEPHEAFVIFHKEVGLALKSAITKQTGICLSSDPEKFPLTFYHETLHFAHATVPYPRIVIEQDLPRQNTTKVSPATLWLWGASHSITLDGTPDGEFRA
ncbi:hypothetical protein QQS21_008779 [Conoideocrella luteorostrata]|uniref:Uncharacterized protein n=1 Tax=Conoideocrella luteorostrata TaxID=1105319 RepID=A0AAJ0CI67_9HYPO|nr:hypothetical protein QQS21_008779 [Conoideocrella luteorostrata]